MLLRRPSRRLMLLLPLLLVFGLFNPAPAAHAQTGLDDVTFWDDTPPPASPTIVDPTTAEAAGIYYLNASGGREVLDGLFPVIYQGRIQVIRDRDYQIYENSGNRSTMHWMMTANIGGELHCFTMKFNDAFTDQCQTDRAGIGVVQVAWEPPTTTRISATSVRTTYQATVEEDAQSKTVSMFVTYSFDQQSKFALSMQTSAEFSDASERNVKFYLVGDMYLDGNDTGPGVYTTFGEKKIIAQVGPTAAGGILEGDIFTSYIADDYSCVFGIVDACTSSAAPNRGPGAAEPFSNYVNSDEGVDIGLGAQWDWVTGQPLVVPITSKLIFLSCSFWHSSIGESADSCEDATDGNTGGQPEPTVVPAFCSTPPTLAIKPDSDTLAVGDATTIWVELANQCRDLPTAPADVLLSFADGMRVLETSVGALNLGQRAAMQQLSLPAGATYGWYAIVRNESAVIPQAVAELYAGAAVVRNADVTFAVPAAAAAPAAAATVAPIEAPAAAVPAPLPTALPNTAAGAADLLPWLFLLALTMIAVRVLQLHRTEY
jgi:hypothetical protein